MQPIICGTGLPPQVAGLDAVNAHHWPPSYCTPGAGKLAQGVGSGQGWAQWSEGWNKVKTGAGKGLCEAR